MSMQRPGRVPTYRQIFTAVWSKLRALRVLDIGAENTETVAGNEVTVSSTLILPASFFPPFTGDEVEAVYQVQAGGPISVIASVQAKATAGAAEGSFEAAAGDFVRVTGPKDIANTSMVLATGGTDATVRGQLTRRVA